MDVMLIANFVETNWPYMCGSISGFCFVPLICMSALSLISPCLNCFTCDYIFFLEMIVISARNAVGSKEQKAQLIVGFSVITGSLE